MAMFNIEILLAADERVSQNLASNISNQDLVSEFGYIEVIKRYWLQATRTFKKRLLK